MVNYLDVNGLSYGTPDGRPLVDNLKFSVNKAEILLIKGPNGIGKTSLLEILSENRAPLSGSIRWNVHKAKIFYLPQLHNREFHISLTLRDVLAFSRRVSDAEIFETCRGLLTPDELGLSWNTASGGERQKTLLCRAFLKNPKVLILDEPMNHLDVSSRKHFESVLRDFVKEDERAVVMVGHHEEDAWADLKEIDLLKAKA